LLIKYRNTDTSISPLPLIDFIFTSLYLCRNTNFECCINPRIECYRRTLDL